jgi:hypothetical protein
LEWMVSRYSLGVSFQGGACRINGNKQVREAFNLHTH